MDFDRLTLSAKIAITWASCYAKSCEHKEVNTRHLLLAMLHNRCSANAFLASLQLTEELAEMKDEGKGIKVTFPLIPIPFASELKEVLDRSYESGVINTLDLLIGIMQIGPNSAASIILSGLKISRNELIDQISIQKSSLEED